MKKITPKPTINLAEFGLASLRPGMMYLRDLIVEAMDQAIGQTAEQLATYQEPDMVLPDFEERKTPSGRLSAAGLAVGSAEYRAVNAYNARLKNARIREAKKAAGKATSWKGMTAEERSQEMRRRQKVARAKRALKAKSEAGRRGALNGWANKTPAQRRKWLAAINAGKQRALAARRIDDAAVNGAA